MLPFYCFRCNKNTSTVDGFRCSHCQNVQESMDPEIENFQPAEPEESGRESPGYYVSVSDASTQANEEDFDAFEPTQDASTQTNDDDDEFDPFELTRDASTQATDSDSSCLDVIVGYHEYIDDASTQATDSDSSCLAETAGYHEYIDESKPIKAVGKLNFDSCNRGPSDCSSQPYCQDSSKNVNTLDDGQEIRNNHLVLSRKTGNDFIVNHYEKNYLIKRSFHEKDQHIHGNSSTNGLKIQEPVNQPMKCIKCGKLLSIAEVWRLCMENNCDQKPYKCDFCNKE